MATAERTAEFDAFGPWIDELHSSDDVPRLYLDYPINFATSLMVLKFPRDISRRDASPTMDLYDYLVIVETGELTVLSRETDGYCISRMTYDRIAAISNDIDLLDARVVIHTLTGEPIVLPYNGASQKMAARFVDLMRELTQVTAEVVRGARKRILPSAGPAGTPTLELDALGKHDVMFVTMFLDIERRERVRLLAAHGRRRVTPRSGRLSKAAHALVPATLHGMLLCETESELQVLSRRNGLARTRRPVTSRVRTIIPLDIVATVTTRDHERYADVVIATIRAGTTTLEYLLPASSDALRVLSALPTQPA